MAEQSGPSRIDLAGLAELRGAEASGPGAPEVAQLKTLVKTCVKTQKTTRVKTRG